ncbi:hypothetical protein [Magnetovibrio sp.]|uniref:hypothetical protein n=1 Tax=Magnetovibrio sp. TaxID=2024836 RepID=UPI002F94ECA6
MQDAQFVFVTEDARVMAMLMDGRLEDVTEVCDLLPRSGALACADTQAVDDLAKKRRALLMKFAA